MSLRESIKTTLKILTYGVQKIQKHKQTIHLNRITTVLQKYQKLDSNEDQSKFLKQLQFNLNFIKLSHPQISLDLPLQENQQQQNLSQKQQQKQSSNFSFEVEGSKQLQKALDEVQMPREEADFSNWWTGNSDPQMIRKHKQLVLRQHFGGDYWKNRPIPTVTAQQFLKTVIAQKRIIQQPIKDERPNQQDSLPTIESNDAWQKIKR